MRCNHCGDEYPELYGPLDSTTGDICWDCWCEAIDLLGADDGPGGLVHAAIDVVLPPDPFDPDA